MIGEKIKIGFDGSAVKRGLGGIMGGFGKLTRGLGSATRQVGIGMGRQMGMSLFGAITRVATALPNQIKDISNLRQEFFALGAATGTSVESMLALRQAISKTSNVSADMAGKALKEMVAKLGEAQEYGSAGEKALTAMGIGRQEILGKNAVTQMRMLANGYQTLRKSKDGGIEIANDLIRDLMGSRVGKDLTPLLLDFEKSMIRGAMETKTFSKGMTDMADDLDAFDDIGRSFDMLANTSAIGFLGVLKKAGIDMRQIAMMVGGLDFTEQFKGVGDFIKAQYDEFNKYLDKGDLLGYFMDKLKALGTWISDMISKAISAGLDMAMDNPKIKGMLESMNFMKKSKDKIQGAGDAIGDFFFGKKNPSGAFNKIPSKENKAVSNAIIEDNTNKTNEILLRMADKGVLAFWGA